MEQIKFYKSKYLYNFLLDNYNLKKKLTCAHPLKYRFYNVQTEPGPTLGLQKKINVNQRNIMGSISLKFVLKIFDDVISDIMLFKSRYTLFKSLDQSTIDTSEEIQSSRKECRLGIFERPF